MHPNYPIPNFYELLYEMSIYYNKLKEINRNEISEKLKNKKGVYVFYDDDKVKYVGKTDNLERRLKEHASENAKNNNAGFAFKLARLEWDENKNNKSNRKFTRRELEEMELFKPHFDEAKKAVRKMQMKYVEIDNPYHQYLFEFWLAVKLKAEHNHFINT